MVPGVALTPPPVGEMGSDSGLGQRPLLEISVGVICILASPELGARQFITDPIAMAGGVCLLNGTANVLPWPRSDPARARGGVWAMMLCMSVAVDGV